MAYKRRGYYKDEYGREYYWDGQHRSYIPQNSYQQFKRDSEEATTWMLWTFGCLIGVPVGLLLIGLAIYGAHYAVSESLHAFIQQPFRYTLGVGFIVLFFYFLFFHPRGGRDE